MDATRSIRRDGNGASPRVRVKNQPVTKKPVTDEKRAEVAPAVIPVIVEAPVIEEPAPAPAGSVEEIVRQAARKYGLDENHFVSIAMCESTMNPNAVNTAYYENGNPSGLFQHISGYYPARALKYGYSTDVFDVYSNANVTAAMWAEGQSYLWECT